MTVEKEEEDKVDEFNDDISIVDFNEIKNLVSQVKIKDPSKHYEMKHHSLHMDAFKSGPNQKHLEKLGDVVLSYNITK